MTQLARTSQAARVILKKRTSCVSRGGVASSCPHLCMRADRGPCGLWGRPNVPCCRLKRFCAQSIRTVEFNSSRTGNDVSVPIYGCRKQELLPISLPPVGAISMVFGFLVFRLFPTVVIALPDKDLKSAAARKPRRMNKGGTRSKLWLHWIQGDRELGSGGAVWN